jgi:hypothetical protein
MKGKKLTYKERVEKLEQDANERKRVFKELCAHVEKGYSLECFSLLSSDSIRMYLKTYKEEFVKEELDESLRKGREMWEDIGNRQANGQCLGNSRTWWLNMAHRYKWSDRLDIQSESKGQVAVNIVSYSSAKPLQCTEKSE